MTFGQAHFKHIHLATVDSTNEAARRLLAEGGITGLTCITADEQTAGKGTRGRIWCSPRGAGLYLSIVHSAAVCVLPVTDFYTQAAGVACAEVLHKLYGLDIRIKPVNDLYVDGKKLGGILTESLLRENKLQAVITGIGINTRECERKLAGENAHPDIQPVSLQELVPPHVWRAFSTEELVADLVAGVHAYYARLSDSAGEIERLYRKLGVSADGAPV